MRTCVAYACKCELQRKRQKPTIITTIIQQFNDFKSVQMYERWAQTTTALSISLRVALSVVNKTADYVELHGERRAAERHTIKLLLVVLIHNQRMHTCIGMNSTEQIAVNGWVSLHMWRNIKTIDVDSTRLQFSFFLCRSIKTNRLEWII